MAEQHTHPLSMPNFAIDEDADSSYSKHFSGSRTIFIDDDDPPTSIEELQGTVEYPWGSITSIRNSDKLELGLTLKLPAKQLNVSTLLGEADLAPIFSGAEWAGTRLWHAAIFMISYLHTHYHEAKRIPPSSTLIELGCGLGVPGLVAKTFTNIDRVVLTDVDSLLSLTKSNVETNFEKENITALPLSWSREGIKKIMKSNPGGKGFDFCIVTDCVYEPLYGKSWELLIEVCDEILTLNPNCVCLHSMERRNVDGIDNFLEAMRGLGSVSSVEKLQSEGVIEIYGVIGNLAK